MHKAKPWVWFTARHKPRMVIHAYKPNILIRSSRKSWLHRKSRNRQSHMIPYLKKNHKRMKQELPRFLMICVPIHRIHVPEGFYTFTDVRYSSELSHLSSGLNLPGSGIFLIQHSLISYWVTKGTLQGCPHWQMTVLTSLEKFVPTLPTC